MPTFKDLMAMAGKTKAKVLTRLRIDEVSSVDRGAGDGVKITLMKRDGERQRSQPSKERSETMNFFANIFGTKTASAAALREATAALAKSVASIEATDPKERSALLAKTFEQFDTYIGKLSVDKADDPHGGHKGEEPMSAAVLKALGIKEGASEEEVLKQIEANNKVLADARDAIEKAKAKFDPDEDKEDDDEKDADKKKAFRAMTHEQRREYMRKKYSTELPEPIRKIIEQAAEDRKRVEKLESERDLVEIRKVCADAGMAEVEAETIKKAYGGDKASVDKLVSLVKAANVQAKAAGAWKEIGGSGGDKVGTTAIEQLNALAAELRKKQPELSQDQAFAKVYADPVNIKLAQQERLENSPRAA